LMDPEILTPRLKLSRLVPGDAPPMFAYRADPEVCRYQSFEPRSLQDVDEFIRQLQPVPFGTPGAWFQFAIRLRESDLLVGDLGTHVMADDPRQVEIGFTLAPSYQGQGLATEAVAGLIGHLFGPGRKHRVFASVDPRNTRSLALLERVGLRQEAHFRESLWFKGEWVDDVVYAILAAEWGDR
jgi:RimJ/RimL family protein N-acetyltransferase